MNDTDMIGKIYKVGKMLQMQEDDPFMKYEDKALEYLKEREGGWKGERTGVCKDEVYQHKELDFCYEHSFGRCS